MVVESAIKLQLTYSDPIGFPKWETIRIVFAIACFCIASQIFLGGLSKVVFIQVLVRIDPAHLPSSDEIGLSWAIQQEIFFQ